MGESKKGSLSTWQLVMLALGTVVGGSFFLGSAITIKTAGPAVLLAFGIGGVLVYLILMALSELTIARPVSGSFREYTEIAFGPMAAFVVGWLYWTGLVLALSSEATATALFARLWFPAVPVWMLSLGVILGVVALNLLDVRFFSMVESVMAGLKLLALVGFVLLMAAVLFGLWPGRAPVGLGAVRTEPFLPTGLGGLPGAMLIVLFTYAGFEVLGLAAPDARDPGRTVPRAIMITVLALISLYILAIGVVLPFLPVSAVQEDVSPLVAVLRTTGFGPLASGLNLIVMSASLSTMLAAMYGLSRMLFSLAQDGDAPALFARTTATGAPRNALLGSGAGMLVGVLLAYLLPKQVYLLLVSSGGFAILVAYLAILASQLVIRRREGCQIGACKMPWYPYSTWFGIILLLVAIAAMPLVPGQGAGLVVGLALLGAYLLLYRLRRRPPAPLPEPQDDPREENLLRM